MPAFRDDSSLGHVPALLDSATVAATGVIRRHRAASGVIGRHWAGAVRRVMTKPCRIDVSAAEARRPASSCGRLVELSVLAEPERTASWIKPDSADLFGSARNRWTRRGGGTGGIESNRVPTTVEVECAEFFSHSRNGKLQCHSEHLPCLYDMQ